MICEKCGGCNPDNAVKCEYCDQPLNKQNDIHSKKSFFNKSVNQNGMPAININLFSNNVMSNNTNVPPGMVAKNKYIAIILCLFTFCGHKFYEGKIVMGCLYILTCGFFGIGWFIDLLILIFKPNPYYLKKK